MTVRLAFSVAAHLEPDILVVDEVLAVGDAEFQKKAIGKMQDISKGEGRTVLFVSHNMAAVKNLCTRGIVLENGGVVFEGKTESGINFYASICRSAIENNEIHLNNFKNLKLNVIRVSKNNLEMAKMESIMLGDCITIDIDLDILENIIDLSFAIDILDDKFELIAHLVNEDCGLYFPKNMEVQKLKIKIKTDKLLMIPGLYSMNFWIGMRQMETIYEVKNFFSFILEQSSYTKRTNSLPRHSKLYLHSDWEILKTDLND
jgi:lipopolysaccharide transport system ATP-binding protein